MFDAVPPADGLSADRPPRPSAGLRRACALIGRRLSRLHDRLKQRHCLRRMAEDYPDYLLRDVGLRREDLLREAERSLWH